MQTLKTRMDVADFSALRTRLAGAFPKSSLANLSSSSLFVCLFLSFFFFRPFVRFDTSFRNARSQHYFRFCSAC